MKNKKKRSIQFLKIALVCTLLFSFWNCNTNEDETLVSEVQLPKNKPTVVFFKDNSDLQVTLQKYTISSKNRSFKGYNLMNGVDFSRALTKYDENLKLTYYTFDIPTEEKHTLRKLVLRKNTEGKFLSHILEFEKREHENTQTTGWGKYTGWFRVFSTEGILISETKMNQGRSEQNTSNKNRVARNNDTGCEAVTTDWYTCVGTVSNPYEDCSQYSHTTVTTRCTWESRDGESSLDDLGRPGDASGLESIDFDEHTQAQTDADDKEDKITNNLTGVALCIYNKLKSLKLFKTTIKKFENAGDYNLTLKVEYGKCNSSVDEACTNASDLNNGNITIYFQGTGNTNLDFASTILHEGIHAEIYKYVDENHNGNIDPEDRSRLFQLYFHYKAQNDNSLATSNAQHQYMAERYVIPIARALRELDGYSYPLDHYLMYGWEGLEAQAKEGYYDKSGVLHKLSQNDLNSLENKRTKVNKNSTFNNNLCQ
ncbi:hypothetical protein [Tenacibaculum agarivorans]|uniref:hypothetical protein n=1 Tax=Tenacibaculum agarivorans TaxID=1908389 RepID=UPI00094BA2A3|nr:hypothetical protein [Tenacibaculum agarivorans]